MTPFYSCDQVEMVCITRPIKEESDAAFRKLVNLQETIYQHLRLPYRVVNIPADDLGDVASRKIDIEVHMPGMGMYGEVTSASECLSYQSSRLNIRNGNSFAYTLNATAVAIPRTLIGIIENYQLPNGSVVVPSPLRPYMGSECLPLKRILTPKMGLSNFRPRSNNKSNRNDHKTEYNRDEL